MSLEALSREFLRVCELAAVEAARTMGQGKRKHSDHVAVEAMRKAMDPLPMRGTVVIGVLALALPHGTGRLDGGQLAHAQEVPGERLQAHFATPA